MQDEEGCDAQGRGRGDAGDRAEQGGRHRQDLQEEPRLIDERKCRPHFLLFRV